jgi:DNA-directed RNA polymerase specialized sigma24 family protein
MAAPEALVPGAAMPSAEPPVTEPPVTVRPDADPSAPGPSESAGASALPVLPGFREMALRRMAAERSGLVSDLVALRQAAGLSQTEVAARMGTSQSAVARLEAGTFDVRASTLERYAAAIGSQITWKLQD